MTFKVIACSEAHSIDACSLARVYPGMCREAYFSYVLLAHGTSHNPCVLFLQVAIMLKGRALFSLSMRRILHVTCVAGAFLHCTDERTHVQFFKETSEAVIIMHATA